MAKLSKGRELTQDRRQWPRAEVPATAVVIAGKQSLGTFAIDNLSASGALLLGGPDLAEGTRVRLLLTLPRARKSLPVHATIVRTEDRRSRGVAIGVMFVQPPAHVQDRIHTAVLSALERETVNRVVAVVVDDCPDTCRTLARQLGRMGHRAASAATPLEAVDLLERYGSQLKLALVDLALGSARGDELLRFMAEEHPDIRRVLISGVVGTNELRVAGREGSAHAIMRKPWERDALIAIAESCVER